MNAPVLAAARELTMTPPVRAIIDIGSNSIRLVVFRADRRTPFAMFNEKVMAGLGEGIAETGMMQDANIALAHETMARFAALCEDMGVDKVEAFATAAVREADNGHDFTMDVLRRTGIDIRTISGKEEGHYAALGVLAGIPGADGIVGDLGGGSLELVRLKKGKPRRVMSLPIGSLKLAEARKGGSDKLRRIVKKSLDKVDWLFEGQDLPFYMVGGSWRALAQLEMHLTNHPLHIVHQYCLSTKAVDRLARSVPNLRQKRLREIRNVSTSRTPHLPGAALLLRAVLKRLGSSHAVVSAYGIREGVFYEGLADEVAQRDPLISAARNEGEARGRFPHHASALMRWTTGLFEGEAAEDTRLRRAAAELSDIAWRAHPDFRAERAMETALYGNWVGIDAAGRAMLGAALFALYGGHVTDPTRARLGDLIQTAPMDKLDRATTWGLALRLGQRLTGGTAEPLSRSRLLRDGDAVILTLDPRYESLWSGSVSRRLSFLATHLGCEAKFEVGPV
ncbi:MAG: Ppx/GppA family phosphatase [Pacificimonas sp.]